MKFYEYKDCAMPAMDEKIKRLIDIANKRSRFLNTDRWRYQSAKCYRKAQSGRRHIGSRRIVFLSENVHEIVKQLKEQ